MGRRQYAALWACFFLAGFWYALVVGAHYFLGVDQVVTAIVLVGAFMFMKEK